MTRIYLIYLHSPIFKTKITKKLNLNVSSYQVYGARLQCGNNDSINRLNN